MRSRVPSSHKNRSFGLFALATVFVLTSCSARRDGDQPGGAASASASLEESADYQYPHTTQWSTQHIGFVSKHAGQIDGTSKDCTSCHREQPLGQLRQMSQMGRPLNVSCAKTCHSPITGNVPAQPSHPIGDNACVKCHATHFARAKPHYPAAAGLCKTCHDVTPEHLSAPGPKTATTTKGSKTCYSCHFRQDSREVVHPAIRMMDACVNCHDPHGSDLTHFLKEPTETLCTGCHDVASHDSKSLHGVIKTERSCLNCHKPHSADRKKLLTAEPKEQCLSCHNQEIRTTVSADPRIIPNMAQKVAEMPFIHSAVKGDDSCSSCHDPHATDFDRLMKKSYPISGYAKYEPGDEKKPNTYATCFGECHDSGMLKKDIDGYDTGFRNDVLEGDKVVRKNLHWYHVVDAADSADKSRGRNCYVCHDPHGATQKHLIKSAWRMSPTHNVTIQYTASKAGGQCTMSCHGVKAYIRIDE